MRKNIEIEITESWEHYKDTLYEYVSRGSKTLKEILNQIGGTKKDIDLAIHDLTLDKKGIIVVEDKYKAITSDLERNLEMKKRIDKIRELQEEINALKEMRFE